jgi:HEAT repeat protein
MTKHWMIMPLLAGAFVASGAMASAQQTGVGTRRPPADTARKMPERTVRTGNGAGQGIGRGQRVLEGQVRQHELMQLDRDFSDHLQSMQESLSRMHLEDFRDMHLEDFRAPLERAQGMIDRIHFDEFEMPLQHLSGQWQSLSQIAPIPPMPPMPPMQFEVHVPEISVHVPDVAMHMPDVSVDVRSSVDMYMPGFNARMREPDARMPASWAQGDAADTLWRNARELVNRGDYRRASNALRDIAQRFPNSAYAGDALYWQAFSLYRIGSTNDLQEALAALTTLRTKYPNYQGRGSQTDVQSLATRIQGTLAARGDSRAAAELKNAASGSAQSCDREEQAVRAEALSALSRTDQENMSALMKTVLARKDECSVQLRKNAVFLVGNKRDAEAGPVLIGVARNDPSVDVRVEAISWLARIPTEEGLSTLTDLAKTSSEDDRVQRAAIRALVNHPSAQARQMVRTLVERSDTPEGMRTEALSALDKDRATVDDIAWLRTIYNKETNPRVKERALSAIVRIGGPESDQFLLSIVKDENESSDLRSTALRRIGQTMSIADIGKMYDAASARSVRESLINILGNRKEPEAIDKLIDIAKTGTDPNLRVRAINALTNKNDPRARQLLLEIINK